MPRTKHSLWDLRFIMSLSSYLQSVEGEKQKLRTQVRCLSKENAWLRYELVSVQQRLQDSDQRVSQLEEQKKYVDSMASIRDIIEDSDDSGQMDSKQDDLMVDLFPDDDHEDNRNIKSINAGCKIAARLRTVLNLSIQYTSQGRYEMAVQLCKQALEKLQETFEHDHQDVAAMLTILALVYHDQNKYMEATKHMNDALAIREKILGENHPAVAATLDDLAMLYVKRGKYCEAEALCKRALCIREAVLDRDHSAVAKQLYKLALLCMIQNKYEEEEQYYQRALEVYKSKPDPDNHKVRSIMSSLAFCYQKQGKFKEAEIICKQRRAHENVKEFLTINDS